MLAAALLNGSVGWVINRSRVPDIVVTLATSFVFSGLALIVLPGPGGGTVAGLPVHLHRERDRHRAPTSGRPSSCS